MNPIKLTHVMCDVSCTESVSKLLRTKWFLNFVTDKNNSKLTKILKV